MPLTLPVLPEPPAGERSPYCVVAKHRAKPGCELQLERRMLADLEATRAEAGCLAFHVHRARADPGLFVIYEVWRDIGALRMHFEQDYVKRFVADAAQLESDDMEVEWLIMASPYSSR